MDGRAPRFADESGKWMLYTPAGDSRAAGGERCSGGGWRSGRPWRRRERPPPRRPARVAQYGSNLVLRNMQTGAEEKMADILAATFDDSAKVLVYTVVSRDTTKDGIFIRDMNTGAVKTVLDGQGQLPRLHLRPDAAEVRVHLRSRRVRPREGALGRSTSVT